MSVNSVLKTVNFGSTKTGLSTVGYTIYDNTGLIIVSARSTSGVREIGTSTGIYCALVSLEKTRDQMILWDTGDASVRYALESHLGQLESIQQGTDFIRPIWESLRQTVNANDTIFQAINKIKPSKDAKDYSDQIKALKDLIIDLKKSTPDISDIKKALTVEVKAPVVNIPPVPEVKVPDYTPQFVRVIDLIRKLSELVPKSQKDYTQEISKMQISLSKLMNVIPQEFLPIAKRLDETMSKLDRDMSSTEAGMKKVAEELNKALQQKMMMDTYDRVNKPTDAVSMLRMAVGRK